MKEVLLGLRVQPVSKGGFLATSDELPGLVAQGRTIAETLEIAQDVAIGLVESFIEHGEPLPPGLQALTATAQDVRIPLALP